MKKKILGITICALFSLALVSCSDSGGSDPNKVLGDINDACIMTADCKEGLSCLNEKCNIVEPQCEEDIDCDTEMVCIDET